MPARSVKVSAKLVGFLLAALLTPVVVRGYTMGGCHKIVKLAFIPPITAPRAWAFTFSFFSIDLTTRVRDFTAAGSKPLLAFTVGVINNVVPGCILSIVVFSDDRVSVVTN